MKEELTTKMHAEFSVSDKTELNHKCFCAISDMNLFSYSLEKAASIYGITTQELQKYIDELSTK